MLVLLQPCQAAGSSDHQPPSPILLSTVNLNQPQLLHCVTACVKQHQLQHCPTGRHGNNLASGHNRSRLSPHNDLHLGKLVMLVHSVSIVQDISLLLTILKKSKAILFTSFWYVKMIPTQCISGIKTTRSITRFYIRELHNEIQ